MKEKNYFKKKRKNKTKNKSVAQSGQRAFWNWISKKKQKPSLAKENNAI